MAFKSRSWRWSGSDSRPPLALNVAFTTALLADFALALAAGLPLAFQLGLQTHPLDLDSGIAVETRHQRGCLRSVRLVHGDLHGGVLIDGDDQGLGAGQFGALVGAWREAVPARAVAAGEIRERGWLIIHADSSRILDRHHHQRLAVYALTVKSRSRVKKDSQPVAVT